MNALIKAVHYAFLLTLLLITMSYMVNLMLDAALKEHEFQDNIRFSRCERMDDIERNAMKGYCQ